MSAHKKLTIIGDGACGKTSMLTVYSTGVFPTEYVPTVWDTTTKTIQVETTMVEMELVDTTGQEDYDRLRPIMYKDADVLLICFSVDQRKSLLNVVEKWAPEAKHFCMDVPFILVGTKSDLRDNPKSKDGGSDFVSSKRALSTAKLVGAEMYLECSSLNNDGVKDVFDKAARIAMNLGKNEKKCTIL